MKGTVLEEEGRVRRWVKEEEDGLEGYGKGVRGGKKCMKVGVGEGRVRR